MMNRRDFIKLASTSSLGFLIGCQKNPLSLDDSDNEEQNPFEGYVPRVNDEPLPKPDYFVGEDVSDSDTGHISFYDRANDGIYNFYLGEWGKGNAPAGNLEVKLYTEDIFNSRVLHIIDSKKRYFPKIYSLSGLQKSTGGVFVEVFGLDKAEAGKRNLFIKTLVGDLPSWNPEDVDDLLGYYYLGDWSVNDFQNLVDKTMLVVSILTGGGASSVASVVSTTNNFIDMVEMTNGIEFIHRVINPDFFIFNQSQDYSVYLSVFDSDLIFFPSSMSSRSSEQDIKYLLPLNEGNSWRFTNGSVEKVQGTRNVKGKKLSLIKGVGIDTYFGFYKDILNQYGYKYSQIGNIFFEPALPVGDSNVKIGKEYSFSSKIISEEYPYITGSINGGIKYIDRENVLLSSGKPYGDCYKAQEIDKINLKNNQTGQEISDEMNIFHWFAKNVGKVKVEYEGTTIELSEVNVIPRTEKPIYSKSKDIYAPAQKIEGMVKKLI